MGVYKTTEHTEEFGEIPITVLLRFMLYINYIPIINEIKRQFDSDSEMFLYLINKYINRIKQLSNQKKSSKKIYQPVCKEYQNTTIRVELKIHQIFSDLSYITGYSISYIIRLMLEWEMQSSDESLQQRLSVSRNSFNSSNLVSSTVVTKLYIHHVYEVESEQVVEEIHIDYG